ncbi:MAG: hypothetical protein Q4Q23_05730 [Methanobacteriaceae archaeon]|nr:hypothetical protein [Methanobacteriaceae archaeon]
MNFEKLDFKSQEKPFFGNISLYHKICMDILTTLLSLSEYNISLIENESKDIVSLMVINLTNNILDSLDFISDNFRANSLIVNEYPLLIEIKQMIDYLLMDPYSAGDKNINLAMDIFSDFFKLIEIKFLLLKDYNYEWQAPNEVINEYDLEIENFVIRLDDYRKRFEEIV